MLPATGSRKQGLDSGVSSKVGRGSTQTNLSFKGVFNLFGKYRKKTSNGEICLFKVKI